MTERKQEKLGEKTVQGRVVGRNKTVVPPEEVYKLAQIGCKNQEIADWFGIDENTLSYNFSVELLKGNATMLIWLGKNILGQSENPFDSDAQEPLPWQD